MTVSKQLWLLAGGNGAGKSTFYDLFLKPRHIIFINADEIAKEIGPVDPSNSSVSYAAGYMAMDMVNDSLNQGISFVYETVFSHPSKIELVEKANNFGYKVVLVYIHLNSPMINEARVSQRVETGGHNVDPQKIHDRIPRTMDHISQVVPMVDEARILNNSSTSDPFQQVAIVKQGRIEEKINPLPDWAEKILENVS